MRHKNVNFKFKKKSLKSYKIPDDKNIKDFDEYYSKIFLNCFESSKQKEESKNNIDGNFKFKKNNKKPQLSSNNSNRILKISLYEENKLHKKNIIDIVNNNDQATKERKTANVNKKFLVKKIVQSISEKNIKRDNKNIYKNNANLNTELNNQKKKNEMLEKNFSEKYNESINYINSQEKKLKEYENKEISILNSKILEYEDLIEKNNEKINNLTNINGQLKKENSSLNIKINNKLIEEENNESKYKNEILELTKELSDTKSKFKLKNDDLLKLNVKNENLHKENENLTFYITSKLNDLNDLFDKIKISEKEVIKYQTEKNKNINQNDIKYEIIDDALNKIKNNLLQLLIDHKSKNEKFENEYSEYKKEKNLKEEQFKSLETENNDLKNQNTTIGKRYEELIKNYQIVNQSHLKLKQIYSEICHDYEILYNQHGKMIDDINAFYEKLNGYFITCGINCDNSKLCQGKTVLQNVILFVEKYHKKEEEIKNANKVIFELNEKIDNQKNTTLIQVKELTNLIDESKNIIKVYEQENENLKNEYDKLNYQFQILLNNQNQKKLEEEYNYSNEKN